MLSGLGTIFTRARFHLIQRLTLDLEASGMTLTPLNLRMEFRAGLKATVADTLDYLTIKGDFTFNSLSIRERPLNLYNVSLIPFDVSAVRYLDLPGAYTDELAQHLDLRRAPLLTYEITRPEEVPYLVAVGPKNLALHAARIHRVNNAVYKQVSRGRSSRPLKHYSLSFRFSVVLPTTRRKHQCCSRLQLRYIQGLGNRPQTDPIGQKQLGREISVEKRWIHVGRYLGGY